MYGWNVQNPDLTGNDKKDIEILKRKIDEINLNMRMLVTQLRKSERKG